ncbi:TPA: hypothetical protein N0F65_009139 [Lagenidium giganteum]|uniref:Distal membrane-arm assembly complex protein 1-like domain-containing protein n=1 Tax=Lagenidium giganteum TaxID=4803 RepID=A0AAV2YGI4_9STRA|nr:TPA: hypothetical protein N0F65_009139 [Lagenidium giganteum]
MPEKQQNAQAREAPAKEYQDCLACRLTGTGTLLGVSAYFFYHGKKVPASNIGQRRWLLACAGVSAAAAAARAIA